MYFSQARDSLITTHPYIIIFQCSNFPAPSSILGHNEYASPVAETPIQILLSECGSLGVAFLHHSTAAAWSNHDGSSFSQSPSLKVSQLPLINLASNLLNNNC